MYPSGYSYPSTGTVTYTPISVERFGAPSYTDLVDGLKPGDLWFQVGTVVKLKTNAFMMEMDDFNSSMHLQDSFFVYLGPEQDFTNGKERHWFLSDSGRKVQIRGWLYDLGWRSMNRSAFEQVIEESK